MTARRARRRRAAAASAAGRLRRPRAASATGTSSSWRFAPPPNNLDPRQANDETSQRVGQLVFSSLMDIGPDLRVTPRLAVRLDNPDPLTYIAHLRRGVKFHDGHELTSKDVVYTYAAFLDPDYISPFKGAFRVLAVVRALDDYTVEFS